MVYRRFPGIRGPAASRVPESSSRIVTLDWLKVIRAHMPAINAEMNMSLTVDMGIYRAFLR